VKQKQKAHKSISYLFLYMKIKYDFISAYWTDLFINGTGEKECRGVIKL